MPVAMGESAPWGAAIGAATVFGTLERLINAKATAQREAIRALVTAQENVSPDARQKVVAALEKERKARLRRSEQKGDAAALVAEELALLIETIDR